MLTVNIDFQDRLINDQLETVKHIRKDENGNVNEIYVKFHDANAGLRKYPKDYFAKHYSKVPIERSAIGSKIPSKSSIPSVIKRAQFPLVLAWACFVHRVQVLTLDEIVVSFDLLRQAKAIMVRCILH